MLTKGQYVRHRMAPDTLMGTIEGVVEIQARPSILSIPARPKTKRANISFGGRHSEFVRKMTAKVLQSQTQEATVLLKRQLIDRSANPQAADNRKTVPVT
jgi:hypothetical protein